MSDKKHSPRRAGKRSRRITIEPVLNPDEIRNSACPDCDAANATHPLTIFGAYLADGAAIGIVACEKHRERVFNALTVFEGVIVNPRVVDASADRHNV